jgi:hypothetical protein
MRHHFILALLALCLASGSARANGYQFSGADVLEYCVSSKKNDAAKERYAQDMVLVCWANFQATLKTAEALLGKQLCLPAATTPTDVMMNSVAWIKRHPARKEEFASILHVEAMLERWACK